MPGARCPERGFTAIAVACLALELSSYPIFSVVDGRSPPYLPGPHCTPWSTAEPAAAHNRATCRTRLQERATRPARSVPAAFSRRSLTILTGRASPRLRRRTITGNFRAAGAAAAMAATSTEDTGRRRCGRYAQPRGWQTRYAADRAVVCGRSTSTHAAHVSADAAAIRVSGTQRLWLPLAITRKMSRTIATFRRRMRSRSDDRSGSTD